MNNDADFIGSIPEHYDQGLGPFIFEYFADDLAQRVAASQPARVLEIAAGTGIATRRLRDALPAGATLVATDLNPPMLEVARKKFHPGEEVELQAADAQALPFADGSFDAVVCQFGVMFFPDRDKAYREAHRVLAPGGRYLLSVWDSHQHNPFVRVAQEVIDSLFTNDPPQFYHVPFALHRIDPIKEALREAGFTGIDIEELSREQELTDAALFARGLVYGNPMIDQLRARNIDPRQVFEGVRQRLNDEFGPDPGRMPLQAIVFSARRPAD